MFVAVWKHIFRPTWPKPLSYLYHRGLTLQPRLHPSAHRWSFVTGAICNPPHWRSAETMSTKYLLIDTNSFIHHSSMETGSHAATRVHNKGAWEGGGVSCAGGLTQACGLWPALFPVCPPRQSFLSTSANKAEKPGKLKKKKVHSLLKVSFYTVAHYWKGNSNEA